MPNKPSPSSSSTNSHKGIRRIAEQMMNGKNRKWTFYVLTLLALMWPLGIMQVWAYHAEKFDVLRFLVITIGNPLLLLAPYFLLAPRWRWTVLVPVWVTAIYCIANAWYCAFFSDLLPFSGMVAFNNYDPLLFESVLQILRPWQFVFLVGAVVFTFVWARWFRKWNPSERFTGRTKLAACVISLLPCLAWEGVEIAGNKLKKPGCTLTSAIEARYFQKPGLSTREEYYGGGIIPFFGRNILFSIYSECHERVLTPSQRAKVKAWLKSHDGEVSTPPSISRLMEGNRGKNLIFIVVESLNADAVTANVAGHEVMPNLRRLLTDSTSVASFDVVSQVGSGMSSDGQFTYNTGLFPATDATTVLAYPNNSYPALPVALGLHGVEVICENPTFWNHESTNRAFGYKALISNTNYRARTEATTRDEALFKTIREVTDTLPEPFMLFTATIGMHSPYTGDKLPLLPWLATANLSQERINYYNTCHKTDSILGAYIADIKRSGLYDRSVIVIASDHAGVIDGKRQEQPIVFGALNTGINAEALISAGLSPRISMEQVDVYPTVLDIMGVLPSAPFKGMGHSAFNSRPATPSDSTSRAVANLMQYGNWFRCRK